MQVHVLISTKGLLLLIFRDGHGYQFRVVSQSFEVFGQTEIFYTLEAAEQAGRSWVK